MADCAFFLRGAEPLTERHVQAMWYDRDIRPERLVSRRLLGVLTADRLVARGPQKPEIFDIMS